MRPPTSLQTSTEYRLALLWLMGELGSARTADAIAEFERRLGHLIPPEHRENNESGNIKWEWYVRYSRQDLVGMGLMGSGGHGIWTITKEGQDWLRDHPEGTTQELMAFEAPPQPKKPSLRKVKTQQPSGRSRDTRQMTPGAINLEMLEKTRQSMPPDQFRQVWGAIYDQLLAEERARIVTDINQTELGRRARRKVEEIQAFLRGQSNASPKSDVLCDWIHFCYELELFREAASLLQYVAEEETDLAIYRRAKRLAEASRVKLGW